MIFQEYITATGLLQISVIIRSNSSVTLDFVLEDVRKRVNTLAVKNSGLDVKAQVTSYLPSSQGNIYEVFSDNWLDKYDQTNWFEKMLDNVSIQEILTAYKNGEFSSPVTPTPDPDPEPVTPTPDPDPEPVTPTPDPDPEPVTPTPDPDPEPVNKIIFRDIKTKTDILTY